MVVGDRGDSQAHHRARSLLRNDRRLARRPEVRSIPPRPASGRDAIPKLAVIGRLWVNWEGERASAHPATASGWGSVVLDACS